MIAPFRWRWEGQPSSVPWEETPMTTSGDSSIQVQADVPPCGSSHSTRRCCRRAGYHQPWTAVCLSPIPAEVQLLQGVPAQCPMIVPTSIRYSYPPWLLRWWRRAVARIQIYWCNLLWTSEGVDRGLCVCSLKSPDWVCPSFFSPLLHLNGKGMSNITKPMSKEVKYKTQCFQVGHMTLCLYSIRFWLFDFGIVSGKYTVHIYFHR